MADAGRALYNGNPVGDALWQSIGWGFASFVVNSTKYAAIYSGFAILILFMIWLYLAWLILLVGASIAFYVQNPAYAGGARPASVSHRAREILALTVLALISRSFYTDEPPWTLDGLCSHLASYLDGFQHPPVEGTADHSSRLQ